MNHDLQDETWRRLQQVATLCNNASFLLKAEEDGPTLDLPTATHDENFDLLGLGTAGDATESGLIKCAWLSNAHADLLTVV